MALRPPSTGAPSAPVADGSAIPLPIQEAVRDFLSDLLGRGVACDKASPDSWPDAAPVGAYRSDDGVLLAGCVATVPLAAACGAALAMLPATALDEVVEDGPLPEHLAENWFEVVNVLSGLLNSNSSPHLVLGTVTPLASGGEVAELVASSGRSRAFHVTIDGYGDGLLGFVTRSGD